MIRKELKVDPIGFVNKFILDGVELSWIERLYVIRKCPKLFPYINNTSSVDERLYLKMLRNDVSSIKVECLKYKSNVKRALKLYPPLCANLDLNKYPNEINTAMTKLKTKERDTFLLLMNNNKDNKEFIRKILMFRPDLVDMVDNITEFNDDSDLQIFMYKCNPRLLEAFSVLSKATIDYIISDDLSNLRYLNDKTIEYIDEETILKFLLDYIVVSEGGTYDSSLVRRLIGKRQAVFTKLVERIITYDGFSSYSINDIVYKRLLREFNDMINDDVAEIVIRGRM